MKKLLLSLTLVALCSHNVRAQFQLNAGESVTFEITPGMFTAGGTLGTLRANANFSYWLNYDASTLDSGDVLLCQFLGPDQTFTSANPRFSNTPFEWTGANGVIAPVGVNSSFPSTVTLTMQSGSMVLNDFHVGIGTPITLTQLQLYTAVVPVPEPSTFALIGMGALLVPAARYFKRRNPVRGSGII